MFYKGHNTLKGLHTVTVVETAILGVHTYSITVESVEDPRYITAQDANRDACVV